MVERSSSSLAARARPEALPGSQGGTLRMMDLVVFEENQ